MFILSQNILAGVVKFLVEECEADLGDETEDGITALHIAADNNYLELAAYLISLNRMDLDVEDSDQTSAASFAARNGHCEILKMLIESGASVDSHDDEGWTLLHHAVSSGKLEACVVLMEWGAKISAKNNEGKTPFLLACMVGELEIVKLFLDNHEQRARTTANCAIGEQLIAPQSSLLDIDDNHANCFHEVASRGHSSLLQFLIDRAKTAPCTIEGQSLIHMLLQQQNDDFNRTPIHLAAIEGHVECVANIVAIKDGMVVSPLEHRDLHGRTVLHLATLSTGCYSSLVSRLLDDWGADPEAMDNMGSTYKTVEYNNDANQYDEHNESDY